MGMFSSDEQSSPYDLQRIEELENKLERLREAVRKVYYATHWTPDPQYNGGDADELWTELRDAAGFEEGNSPDGSQ